MLLSSRETLLLSELVSAQEPVSLERMMTLLKVSRRTVYRELSNLEYSLKSVDAKLIKVNRGSFQLSVEPDGLAEIQSWLTQDNQELSTTQRQHAILAQLLRSNEPISMQTFLDAYQISNTTFFADIKQLEERLESLPLSIDRNMGYEINGPERYRRLLLANILVMEINEYLFFHFSNTTKNEFFLQFVDADYLILSQEILREVLEPNFAALSDRKMQFLMLLLAISMERVSQGQGIRDSDTPTQISKDLLKAAKHIFMKVAEKTKQLYTVNEIVFFANLLGDFLNSFDNDFFDEYFDTNLAYQVRQLIELISEETEIDFFEDTNLYKMLLTHLSATLSRAILQEKTLNNPILERIVQQYAEIAEAIRKAVPLVFAKKQFSEEEVAYMVLHFANSLEQNPNILEIDIAGISTSGLASTSILEMRLRKYFPFINDINFYRVADLERFNLQEKYDLIISTSLLPGYQGKYKLVSPLLTEEEINQLKEEFKKIGTRKKGQAKEAPVLNEERYEEVIAFINEINGVLERFGIVAIGNPANIEETLDIIVQQLPTEIVSDPQKVKERLLSRYQQAPIGIPNTRCALFHTSCDAVKVPCFLMYDLSESLEIEGMDKAPMKLQRMLVMLAPDPIEDHISKILGKISGAIIMNDLNVEIFNSGNEAIVYQLLASLLIEEVKK